MMHINGKKLITLRRRSNLSAETLAYVAGIGRATITRIENGRTTSSNSNTIEKLARALRCQPEDLAAPPAPADAMTALNEQRDASVHISVACQNALMLIARRYGEEQETILELAPLLFDIVARESLIERRKNLDELRVARNALNSMSSRFPHLGDRYTNDWDAEEADFREERSIARNDIRGNYVHSDEALPDCFFPRMLDDDERSPFVAHIRRRCQLIADEGYEAPHLESVNDWVQCTLGFPEADDLAGGDKELSSAIMRGLVPIATLPKQLLKDERLQDRKQWMREQIEEWNERARALADEIEIELEDLLRAMRGNDDEASK